MPTENAYRYPHHYSEEFSDIILLDSDEILCEV